MENIKRLTLSLTLFFLCSTAMVHAQITNDKNQGVTHNKNCMKLVKKFKLQLNRALKVHKGVHQTLQSNQPIDKYNRHMNILFGNLDREAVLMEKLLINSEKKECGKLTLMRRGVVSIKKIHNEMMASLQLPKPKEPLSQQNKKLKSELKNMLKADL